MSSPLKSTAGAEVSYDEGESGDLTITLQDTSGTTIDASTVGTLTFTLFDQHSGIILNSRNDVSIKTTAGSTSHSNGGTVSTAGIVTMRLDAADNAIQSTNRSRETHIARVKFTWSDGQTTRTGITDKAFTVANLVTPTTA